MLVSHSVRGTKPNKQENIWRQAFYDLPPTRRVSASIRPSICVNTALLPFTTIGASELASLNMADDAESQYNNSNRAFLQAFIARSTLTFEEAKPLLAAIFTAHGESLGPSSNARIDIKPVLTTERETRDSRRGCHPSGLQFLHLRCQQCHLPFRPGDPQHLSPNNPISHLRSGKLD